METLKIVIKAKIATAQENLLKEEIHKLFERIFLKEYNYASERVDEDVEEVEYKCMGMRRRTYGRI